MERAPQVARVVKCLLFAAIVSFDCACELRDGNLPRADDEPPIVDPEPEGPPPPSGPIGPVRPRITCYVEGLGERAVGPYGPEPELDIGQICIQSGHPGPREDIQVDVDNPLLWVKESLVEVPTKADGPQQQAIEATDVGWWDMYVDFDSDMLGTMVPLPDSRGLPALGEHQAALSDRLETWPGFGGQWGWSGPQDVTLVTPGARLGFRGMRYFLREGRPGSLIRPQHGTRELVLNPGMALVPVQVVVLYHKDIELHKRYGLEYQLALWDNVGRTETFIATSQGEVLKVRRKWDSVPVSRARDAVDILHRNAPPDQVWQRCGVQFRIVDFHALQVDDREIIMPLKDYTHQTRVRMTEIWIRGQVPSIPGVQLVYFTYRCNSDQSFGGYAQGEALPHGTACISIETADEATLSHELGHTLAGSRWDYHTTGSNAGVMPTMGAGTVPTDFECALIRNAALSRSSYFSQL